MSAAAAQIIGQGLFYLLHGWSRICVEKRLCGHDHPVRAITTLYSLLIDKSPLQSMWLLNGSQPFKGDDLGTPDSRDRCYARSGRHSVQKDRTGPTLAK